MAKLITVNNPVNTNAALAVLRASMGVAPVAPVAPAKPNGKGAATLARWAKGNVTGGATLAHNAFNAGNLPGSTTVTVLRSANPKGGKVACLHWAASYGAVGAAGRTVTVAQAIAGMATHGYSASSFYQNLAWDINHGFLAIA